MHAEPVRRTGDVAVALLEHALGVLPGDTVEPEQGRWHGRRRRGAPEQGVDQLTTVDRLGEIVDRPGPQPQDHRGEAVEPGDHHDPERRLQGAQFRNQLEPAGPPEPKLDHAVAEAGTGGRLERLARTAYARHRERGTRERTLHARATTSFVVHQQETTRQAYQGVHRLAGAIVPRRRPCSLLAAPFTRPWSDTGFGEAHDVPPMPA